jgi:hypothetical protein
MQNFDEMLSGQVHENVFEWEGNGVRCGKDVNGMQMVGSGLAHNQLL